MVKKIGLLVYLFLASGFLYSQISVFYKLYDYNNQYDGTTSTIQTTDNCYLIAGGTYNDTIPSDALFIVKINYKGDTIWETITDPNPQGDNAACVVENLSHDYIISGTTKDSAGIKADVFLMDVDNNGAIKWFYRYGWSNNDYNEKVILTSDGGYLLAGSTLSNTNGYEDAYLVKTDSLGNQQWAKQYGGNGSDIFYSVIQMPDGSYLAAGTSNSYNTTISTYIAKIDTAGNLKWYKTISYGESSGALDFVYTTGTDLYLVGNTYVGGQSDAYLLKTDTTGNKIWEKTFSKGSDFDGFSRISVLPGGDFVCGGTTRDYSNVKPRAWFVYFNENGDTLWTKTYTYYGGSSSDYLYDMQPTNDGGFVMSGMIINNPLPYKNDIFVIKTDSLGNTCVPVPASHDGCWDTITEVQSPKFQASGSRVLIYPNPSQGLITVEYSSGYLLEIIDFTGKKVFLQQVNEDKTRLNLETLRQGIYFYRLTGTGSSIQAGKLIITK